MQVACQTRLDGRKGKRPEELGARPENSKGANRSNYAPGLTEWLVRTLLLVSAEEYSDGRQAERAHHIRKKSDRGSGDLVRVYFPRC